MRLLNLFLARADLAGTPWKAVVMELFQLAQDQDLNSGFSFDDAVGLAWRRDHLNHGGTSVTLAGGKGADGARVPVVVSSVRSSRAA